MMNFGPHRAEIGWLVWGTPKKNLNGFRVLVYCTDVAQQRPTKLCIMFGRPLGWCTILFWGLLSPNGILPGAKFTLRPRLAFSNNGSVTARHSSSGSEPNFAAWYKKWNDENFASRHFQQRAPPIFRGRPSRWA